MMEVRFLSLASREVADAVRWYETRAWVDRII